jgi:putative membrane protein
MGATLKDVCRLHNRSEASSQPRLMCSLSRSSGLALAEDKSTRTHVIKGRGGKMRRSWSATLLGAGIFTVVVGFGIAGAQGSLATRETQRPPAPLAKNEHNAAQPTGDHDFVSQAALSNMVAIQLGHMATKKAQRVDVQQFAQTTIDEHLKAQQQLADAAYGAGIRWPTKLDERYRKIQQRLSKLSNDQFDREYMKEMIDGHRDVEKMLTARVGNGGSETDSLRTRPTGAAPSDEPTLAAKVNQWAARTLPEVRAHLKEAERVFGELDKGE